MRQRVPYSARHVAAAAAAAWTAVAAPVACAADLPIVSIRSMTGPVAFAGAIFQQSIRLAVDEANAKGGIHGNKITEVVVDSHSGRFRHVSLPLALMAVRHPAQAAA